MADQEDSWDGYISDESDFHGPPSVVAALEERARSFDVEKWFRENKPKPEVPEKPRATLPKATLTNPYKDLEQARQLTETVKEFLKRLVPSKREQTPEVPCIRVANPYLPHRETRPILEEGPALGEINIQDFVTKGTTILREMDAAFQKINENMADQPDEKRYEALSKRRKQSREEIRSAAKEYGVTSGKWVITCESWEADIAWSAIVKATVENDLGTAAKVSLPHPEALFGQKFRTLYIYTADFSDVSDVTRVLRKMKQLDLWSNRRAPIKYIPDACNYLKIPDADIHEALYLSRELIPPKSRKQT